MPRDFPTTVEQRSAGPKFLITMRASPDNTARVQSTELVCGDRRARNSYTSMQHLDDLFDMCFSEQLRHLIASLDQAEGMFAMPGTMIKTKSVTFRGVTFFAAKPRNGSRQIIVRFADFVGNPNDLFVSSAFHQDSFLFRLSDNAVEITETMIMKASALVDSMMGVLETNNPAHVQQLRLSMQTIKHNMEELEFYNTLLLRQADINRQAQQVRYVPFCYSKEAAAGTVMEHACDA